MVNFGNMLYNRKAKARAACFFGTAFIHAIKTFKNTRLTFFGNSYSRIFYNNSVRFYKYDNFSTLFRITDCIIDQVENHFVNKFRITQNFSSWITI